MSNLFAIQFTIQFSILFDTFFFNLFSIPITVFWYYDTYVIWAMAQLMDQEIYFGPMSGSFSSHLDFSEKY